MLSTCNVSINCPDDIAGKKVRCPKCGANFIARKRESEEREEPWFYGYVERYGKTLQILAYVMAVLLMLPPTLGLVLSLFGGSLMFCLALLGWLVCAVLGVVLLLLWQVGVACILMAVAAARNVRMDAGGTRGKSLDN